MYYTVYNIQYSKWYLESKCVHECEPHKRKTDIEKNAIQKCTRFTSNKLCCNELIIYYICEKLQSNFVTKSCKRVNHTWCKRSESFWQTLHHLLCAA